MFICYPTIYDMTMLEFVSYMKILFEWKHPVYPDSILKTRIISRACARTYGLRHFLTCINSFIVFLLIIAYSILLISVQFFYLNIF
jgi:hypothetical protein